MIALDLYKKQLQIVRESPATTNELQFTLTYLNVVDGISSQGTTNGTSIVIMATGLSQPPSLALQGSRLIKNISIYNSDTVIATVTIQLYDGINTEIILSILLGIGYTLHFGNGQWYVTNITGSVETVIITASAITIGDIVNGSTGGGYLYSDSSLTLQQGYLSQDLSGIRMTDGSATFIGFNSSHLMTGSYLNYDSIGTIQVSDDAISGNEIQLGTASTTITHAIKITIDTPRIDFVQLTASTVPYLNANKSLVSSIVTPTELGYLSGVTSAIQTQLNSLLTNTLANTKIFIGNGSNVAVAQTLSLGSAGGTFGLANTGVVTMPNADTGTRGLLLATDWNTFNNKQSTLTIGNLTDAGTDGIIITGGTGSVIGSGTSISQHISDTTHNGYLSSTDWITFNSKESGLTFSTGLTRSTNTITVNTSQNIAKFSNLTNNGFVKTSGGDGTLSIDTTSYLSISSAASTYAPIASPTFTGTVILGQDAASGLQAVTYQQLQIAINGVDKEAVKYATIAALPSIIYNNTNGTLTGVAFGALGIDSASPSVGDYILIKNQVSTFQNGWYIVTATGSGIAVFLLTRRFDSNASAEFKTGDASFVSSGSTLATTTWAYSGIDSPTLGTDAITFVQTSGPGSYIAGNGILITGTTISIDTSVTVDKTTVQTLTNKTLTAPTISATANITDSTNKRFVTDAYLTILGNTSGTNTGDQTNISGNAATVTTNANLTGVVTSVGNATSITLLGITNGMIAASTIDLTAKVTGVLPIANGGTNASTLSAAQTNLGISFPLTFETGTFSPSASTSYYFSDVRISPNTTDTNFGFSFSYPITITEVCIGVGNNSTAGTTTTSNLQLRLIGVSSTLLGAIRTDGTTALIRRTSLSSFSPISISANTLFCLQIDTPTGTMPIGAVVFATITFKRS